MYGLDAWDAALLAMGGYVSVITLVRMMRRRREGLVDDLMEQVKVEKKRLQEKKRREGRAQARDQTRQQKAA
ncbi:MAG: hypothetical protein ACC655_10185 [Rhodothermia bacterium]